MLQQIPFTAPTERLPNLPFPFLISNDPFVLYHGTSSQNERTIDQEGLRPKRSLFELAELKAIVLLFKSIGWRGSSGASLAVLEPFSINHDFAHPEGKPLYLAESSHRACLYASLDFAGGEIARAVRHAFRELWSYVQNPAVREKHREQVQREIEYLKGFAAVLPPIPRPDLSEVRTALNRLSDVMHRAEQAQKSFKHGIVYAVKLGPEDLDELVANNSMGVKCSRPLPPRKLVAKTYVPAEYLHNPYLAYDYLSLASCKGIVAALHSRQS